MGNLSFDTTEEELAALIESSVGSGTVRNVRLAVDRETGRKKGFAHVDLTDAGSAQKAVDTLNKAVLRDREIRVDMAQRKEDLVRSNRSNSFGARESGGSRPPFGQHSVFIGNLAWEMNTELVEEMIDDVLGKGLYTKVSQINLRCE